MAILDTVITILLVGGFIFLLYKWLKEPIDALFALIKKGFGNLKDKQQEMTTTEVIKYG